MAVEVRRVAPYPAASSDRPRRSGARAMARADVPAVARLFNRAFRRQQSQPGEELVRYLETVFLGSPGYAPEHGSVVHENDAGGIDSAMLSLPMEFTFRDRRIVGRLLCAFMVDGKTGAAGAARLARSLRATRQELCFSDNASPVSADHCVAGGGIVLPVQSLEWQRFFRPLAGAAIVAGRRFPMLRSRLLAAALRPLDRLLRRWSPSVMPGRAPGCRTRTASLDEFLGCAGPMLQRFSLRPAWSKREFDWLVGVAALNRSLGALQCRKVEEDGRTIGAFLFFGRPNHMATVLNVLCEEGREFDVTAEMFAYLDAEGYAAAVGMAQPFLMNAISRQRWLSFRHRGYFCFITRHADLRQAAERNDIYVGGLASESWSRLLTDFF
jgi:hypothetical protein